MGRRGASPSAVAFLAGILGREARLYRLEIYMKSGHVDAAGNAAKHAEAVLVVAFPVNPPANTFKAGPAGR